MVRFFVCGDLYDVDGVPDHVGGAILTLGILGYTLDVKPSTEDRMPMLKRVEDQILGLARPHYEELVLLDSDSAFGRKALCEAIGWLGGFLDVQHSSH